MAIAYVDCGKRLTGYDPISWRETIADVIASGSVSHAALAAELNRREIEAARGGRWYPTGVARRPRVFAALGNSPWASVIATFPAYVALSSPLSMGSSWRLRASSSSAVTCSLFSAPLSARLRSIHMPILFPSSSSARTAGPNCPAS